MYRSLLRNRKLPLKLKTFVDYQWTSVQTPNIDPLQTPFLTPHFCYIVLTKRLHRVFEKDWCQDFLLKVFKKLETLVIILLKRRRVPLMKLTLWVKPLYLRPDTPFYFDQGNEISICNKSRIIKSRYRSLRAQIPFWYKGIRNKLSGWGILEVIAHFNEFYPSGSEVLSYIGTWRNVPSISSKVNSFDIYLRKNKYRSSIEIFLYVDTTF